MSDPENKTPKSVTLPMHMTRNQCGPFTVISATAPGLVISITLTPALWHPKALQGLLEAIAPALGDPGTQPADTADTTWAEKPRGDA